MLRDILYVSNEVESDTSLDLGNPTHISDLVFAILRNARAIRSGEEPNLVVCWGGHSYNFV